jgi:hypothetical protein
MYPQNELTRLAAYKAALRRDITRRRAQCVGSTVRVLRPFVWADGVWAFCRRLQPLASIAAVPVISQMVRLVFPRQKLLGAIARWSPIIVNTLGALKRSRPQ